MHEAEGQSNQRAHVAPAAPHEVVGADEDDAQRNRGFDHGRRRRHQVERRQRQCDAVANRERRHDLQQRLPSPAQKQETNQEEDMVRPDQDVMNACRHEHLDDGNRALRRARVISAIGIVDRQDELLSQLAILVDVHKRLVQAVVRKHHRMDAEHGRPRRVDAEMELDGLSIGNRVDVAPLEYQRSVACQLQSLVDERGDAILVARGHTAIEQRLGLREPEFVSGIDDVDNELTFNPIVADAQIEVAERSRVSNGGSRYERDSEDDENPLDPPFHGSRILAEGHSRRCR